MKLENHGNCAYCGNTLSGCRVDAIYCRKGCCVLATKKRTKTKNGKFTRGHARKCVKCGGEFQPIFNRHVYCSDECNRSDYNKRNASPPRQVNCKECGETFVPNSSGHIICSKTCISKRHRRYRLLATYGLTEQTYDEIFQQQGGGCAICTTALADRFVVDHDHSCCSGGRTCGKCIRGILCNACNQALGLLRDSPKIIRSALRYITESNEPNKPGSLY